jgi:2-amino-4-hydroxy-6-hydroxymethyldihydropteridine diphosphokinase
MRLKTVFLSLGSNLGRRRQQLELALEQLETDGIRIVGRSSLYETEPQDVRDQPWFLNLVVACQTTLFPIQLLAALQRIENRLGRVRNVVRRGPRNIDIDILLYGNTVIKTARLTIPHPRMAQRRFVLEPLLEIQPDLRHPETKEPWSKFLPTVRSQPLRKLGAQ